MLTGQLSRTDLFEFANQPLARGNLALRDDSEVAFALLYTEALGLAGLSLGDNQYSGIGATIDNEFGLLATDDYGGPTLHPNTSRARQTQAAKTRGRVCSSITTIASRGPGARERQFNDQDNEREPPGYNSSMGRLTSQNRTAQIEPLPDDPSTITDADGQPKTTDSFCTRVSWLPGWTLTHLPAPVTIVRCCRLGWRPLSTQDRPRSGDAGDYGPFLLRTGHRDSYAPQVGDTVVFDKTAQHPYGHIEMYDGQRWVSDFMQRSFSPYRDAASTPPFTIYRLT